MSKHPSSHLGLNCSIDERCSTSGGEDFRHGASFAFHSCTLEQNQAPPGTVGPSSVDCSVLTLNSTDGVWFRV